MRVLYRDARTMAGQARPVDDQLRNLVAKVDTHARGGRMRTVSRVVSFAAPII